MSRRGRGILALALVGWLASMVTVGADTNVLVDKPAGTVRIATFNASLVRKGAGVLLADFARAGPGGQIANVAEIIQRVRPDVLLINEIDHDPQGRAADLLRARLSQPTQEAPGIDYPHSFTDEVNTGVPSGHDLDGDGEVAGPRDAFGFGRFPGQYGMALLSRLPLADPRTFRLFRWSAMPGASRPATPDGRFHHADNVWNDLRLSSKSHWDIPVLLPDGRKVHLLASHPTPPVFDGPEDLNGRRNADEIRFWVAYIDGADWIVDDSGTAGGLPPGTEFVVLGDLNADPLDGDGRRDGIRSLLGHPRVQDPRPTSPGAAAAETDADRDGDKALHTADWPERNGPGNLRVDYVLPSRGLAVAGAGVFWPARGSALHRLVSRRGRELASSDHRLVWVDIRLEPR